MRLTYKLEKPIDTKYLHYDYMRIADYDISRGNYGRITDSEIYNKLGQLEDIEDKLGIDLVTFFKIMEKIDDCVKLSSENLCFMPDGKAISTDMGYVMGFFVYIKEMLNNYGKTWALTKEELL